MKKKGFTLIELLVVIAIIAILLSVLIPSLKKVKLYAQSVICKSNLKQLGTIWKLYGEENDASFPTAFQQGLGYQRGAWILSFRQYLPSDKNILLCPAADRFPHPQGRYGGGSQDVWENAGGVFFAYSMGRPTAEDIQLGITEPELCSYGMNIWCANTREAQKNNLTQIQGRPINYYWETFNTKASPSVIPLMLDSMWRGGGPMSGGDKSRAPAEFDQWGTAPLTTSPVTNGAGYEIQHFAVPRHTDGVNSVFVDLSVDRINLLKLWEQEWHKNCVPFAPSNGWPTWMNKYKKL